MNNSESEWKPAPTDPETLKRVRLAVKATASAADVARLRSFIVHEAKGIIPHEVRGGVWMHLLGVNSDEVYAETSDQFAKRAMESVKDDNSKEQILKDVTRTRPSLETFRQTHVRNALIKLLSLFCKRQGVRYSPPLPDDDFYYCLPVCATQPILKFCPVTATFKASMSFWFPFCSSMTLGRIQDSSMPCILLSLNLSFPGCSILQSTRFLRS